MGLVRGMTALPLVDTTPCVICRHGGQKWLTNEERAACDRVIEDCADFFGVREEELRGQGRHAKVAAVRHIAAYCIRVGLGFSLQLTGEALGRDHSTITYAVQRVEADPHKLAHANEILKGLRA